ncbi:MAG: hypothetical protein IJO40_08360, partial [Thermoguttaceae bacterium]|nr:hypothetical protein [Thermoguttaceae bacterium]
MRKIFTAVLAFAVFGAAFALSASSVAAQDAAKPARTFEEYVPWLAQTGLDLTDYHIHLRGGMT